MKSSESGFIALITIILLTVILIIITAVLEETVYNSRMDALYREYKLQSFALAQGCAHEALIKIAENFSYAGGESNIPLGNSFCNIGTVALNAVSVTVSTNAKYPPSGNNQSYTSLKTTIALPALTITAIEEIP